MKTKEELDALKEEIKTLNEKLAELNDEEMKEVTGGTTNLPVTKIPEDDLFHGCPGMDPKSHLPATTRVGESKPVVISPVPDDLLL